MKKKKHTQHNSGIGGQAVLEGVMMRNGENYAVAVRRPDNTIEVLRETYKGILQDTFIKKIPVIRGFFIFLDSLILGLRVTQYSASMYEDESADPESPGEKLFDAGIMVISFAIAIVLFVLLPYGLADLLSRFVHNENLLAVFEGILRLVIFLIYIAGITAMKDIRRLYQYHGAEHKCINCIENGLPLTVENAGKSTRLHKRCGSSFILFVVLISIILFFFIRVDGRLMRILLRILMIPVISGISYEFIRAAGSSDNPVIRTLSKPGLWLQHLTTKEPDEEMLEVGIASVEAVFDWRAYLDREFGCKSQQ